MGALSLLALQARSARGQAPLVAFRSQAATDHQIDEVSGLGEGLLIETNTG